MQKLKMKLFFQCVERVIHIEIKFKNGSKLENIESEDNKRSYPTRIKFGEWEDTTSEMENHMVDCKGNELNIGDEVVYVHGKNTNASLQTGTVSKFYKGCLGRDECSVDGATHILSHRIMKLN